VSVRVCRAESKPLDTSDENLKSTLALADAAFRAYKWEDAAESYTVALEIMYRLLFPRPLLRSAASSSSSS
jgi:hypothetical protein